MAVNIKWVDNPVEVSVDMSLLTWGDVVALQNVGDDEEKALAALEGVVAKVTGQDAKGLPAQVFTAVVDAIMERANGDPAKN